MNQKIGITFGAFEIFHQGHFNLLREAASRCEKLIVCVSDDDYIRKHKGHSPYIPLFLRKQIVASMPFVDLVDTQTEYFSKQMAVDTYCPDVIFVGDDWNHETFSGEGLGVPVEYLPHTDGISSTILRSGK